ncbi:Glutamate receptor-like 40, partial [Homarus americanus]
MGHKFRVVVRRYFPTIDFHRVGKGTDTLVSLRDSLNTRMLQAITPHLNITYELHEAWDGEWGALGSDGNWSGLVGTLQHQKADFSTTITPTAPRLLVMEHIRIYASDPFIIISAKPRPLAPSQALITPFTGEFKS